MSSTSARRFAARARARRFLALRPLLVVAGLVAVAGFLVWVFLGSSWLAVRTVSVSGAHRTPAAEVLRLADVTKGTPLARIDTDAIARRVDTVIEIASVEVIRRWPQEIRIEVRERVPTAVLQSATGFQLVDPTGVVFDSFAKRPAKLPLVVAGTGYTDPASLRAAVSVLASLPASISTQVLSVSAATPDAGTLRLTKKRTVVWGSADRAARKAMVLRALLTVNAKQYDVSAPDTPTTR